MKEDLSKEWELFSRREKEYEGKKHFYERWVHRASKSGCVFFSTVDEEGKVIYVVEGYGIGTVDPGEFREIADFAPIQRSVHKDEEKARRALRELMTENLEIWRKYRDK